MGKITLWRHPGHLVWIVAAYIPFLWDLSIPFTGDQKTYIAIALEMRERGEWLQPYLFGEPNYLKPPFQYWMTLLSWKLFGLNVFATFFPSVLALLGTAWLLNEIASLLGERRWYVNSGLWFASSVGAMTYALSAQMDIYVCLFYAAAWWAGLRFLASDHPVTGARDTRWLYAAFLIAGLSSLVKSPLYAVLWVAGYFIYLLISGEWLLFKNKHVYLSWGAGILAGTLWFVALFLLDRERFWDQYFIREQISKGGNGGTLANLWLPLFYWVAPMTFLLVTALRSAWIGRRTTGILSFAIAWCVPPAAFFSIFPYRTSLYLFILVPALAVVVDWGCFRAHRTRTFRWLARGTGILLAISLAVIGAILFRIEFIPFSFFFALTFIGSAAAVVLWMGWLRIFTLTMLAAILLLRIGSVEIAKTDRASLGEVLGHVEPYQAAMLDESRDIWHEIGLLSTVIESPMRRLSGYDDLIEQLSGGGVVVLSDEQEEKYHLTLGKAFEERGQKLEWKSWKRFKRRKTIPVKDLLVSGSAAPGFEEALYRNFWIVRVASGTGGL